MGQVVLDSHMCLFCSPTPLTNSFLSRDSTISISILFRCSAILSKFGKEIYFWMDICELLDRAINANTPLCRLCLYFWCFCLSKGPELNGDVNPIQCLINVNGVGNESSLERNDTSNSGSF